MLGTSPFQKMPKQVDFRKASLLWHLQLPLGSPSVRAENAYGFPLGDFSVSFWQFEFVQFPGYELFSSGDAGEKPSFF